MENQAAGQEQVALTEWDYTQLKDVGPADEPVTTGVYELQIVKAERRVGQQSGNPYANFTVAVVNDGKFNGKRIFSRVFYVGDKFSARLGRENLQRIERVTGVQQPAGAPLTAWFQLLSEVQPRFKTKVEYKPDVDWQTKQPKIDPVTGEPEMIQEVIWKEAQIAS